MHIQCTICSDLVNQAESLYGTKCGHIFHHHCLAQWIERSKSCPQCRNKVTERCMFRLYPTVSEASREDAATLQARLDNAMLQLRTQQADATQLQGKLATAEADAANKDALLAEAEKRLVSQECAAAALKQKLAHARAQGQDAGRLRDDNQQLQKTLQTLNGLQRVLHATAAEAEDTLRGYSDPRTVATFAAALKRALCESESKKRSWRTRQLQAARELAELQDRHRKLEAKLLNVEKDYEALKQKKRKNVEEDDRAAKVARPAPAAAAPAAPAAPEPSPAALDTSAAEIRLNDAVISEDNMSFSSLVDRIVQSESPYLSLQRSGLALCTLRRRAPPASLRPSELAILSSSATSIFRQKEAAPPSPAPARTPEPYDGLGGRARPEAWPRAARPPPRPAPRPSARHRLRPPAPAGCRDITTMFRSISARQASP